MYINRFCLKPLLEDIDAHKRLTLLPCYAMHFQLIKLHELGQKD